MICNLLLYSFSSTATFFTMPVNGLLITLTEDETLTNDALLAIAEHEGIELGERTEKWQPVVVETAGVGESHEVHEWLEALPGVMKVDVIFTSVGDTEDGDEDFESDQAKQAHLQEQLENVNVC
jgi:nitrate reductase NapAB chaperone NapD